MKGLQNSRLLKWNLSESRGKRGFTIVELLIVVVVIAILAAITIVAYNGISNQAKDSAMEAAVSQLEKTLRLNRVENPGQPYLTDIQTATTAEEFFTLNQLTSFTEKLCPFSPYPDLDPKCFDVDEVMNLEAGSSAPRFSKSAIHVFTGFQSGPDPDQNFTSNYWSYFLHRENHWVNKEVREYASGREETKTTYARCAPLFADELFDENCVFWGWEGEPGGDEEVPK